jgi:hypothetical protein
VAGFGRSEPTSIDIPAIGVHAPIGPTDLAADGTPAMPARGPAHDTAVWYDQSATPGEIGPSVIAGHLDSACNGPSVFYRLGALAPGDPGGVRRPRPAGAAADHVRGELDPETRHYLDNTVVFAGFAAFDPRPDAE